MEIKRGISGPWQARQQPADGMAGAERLRPGLRGQRRPYAFSVLVLAALVIKLATLGQLHDHPLLAPVGQMDSAYYVRAASEIVAGSASPEAYFVSPLYLYFLAAVFFLARETAAVAVGSPASLLAVKLIQVLFGAAAVGLIYLTARSWFGPRAGWIAGFLALATGLFTFYEVLMLQAALDPFLTALGLYFVSRAWSGGRWPMFLAAGLTLGLLALNRPNVLPYAAVLAAIAAFGRSRTSLVQAGALAAGVAVAVAPVTARNYLVAGDRILISSHGGLNFYIGNHADADGTYRGVPGITPTIVGQADDARRVAEAAEGRSLQPSEVSAYFYRQAWQWIWDHPGQALHLFARKVLYLFNATSLTLNYSYRYYSFDEATWLKVLPVGPWLLIPAGIVGLVFARPRPAPVGYWVWAGFVPGYGLAVAAFFVSSRYRLPMLVPLCAGAGAGCALLWERLHHAGRRSLLAPVAALLALGLLTNRDLGLDDGRSEERTQMILHLIDRRDYGAAKRLLARVETDHPQPALLHVRVGRAWMDAGQPSDAARHFQAALGHEPGRPEIRLFLGQALLDAGRSAEALPHLEAARRAGVMPEVTAYDLARALVREKRREEAASILGAMRLPAQSDPRSSLALGDLALEIMEPALAERFFRDAVARAPDVGVFREKLGLALALDDRLEEGLAELRRSIVLDPGSPTAHLNLAVVLAQTAQFAAARSHAERALALRPDYDRARELLARLDRVTAVPRRAR